MSETKLNSNSVQHVTVTSPFWKRYQELVVSEVLPYQWAVMNDEADINMSERSSEILWIICELSYRIRRNEFDSRISL